MPLRYYPSFKVQTNLNSKGGEFTLDGKPYTGKYYLTYDGRAFTGPDPQIGPSQLLTKTLSFPQTPGLNNLPIPDSQKKDLAFKTNIRANRIPGKPNSFYPQPTEDDYKKGYVIRYFTKRENEKGYVIEISRDEYNSIINGTADYDISIYQTTTILWKLVGPLRSVRQSQYNIIPGIIETNERLTLAANKTFLGILEFIGGDYAKFARPTL